MLPAPLVAVQSCGWDVNFPFRTAAFLQIGFQNDGLHVITPFANVVLPEGDDASYSRYSLLVPCFHEYEEVDY